MVLRPRDRGSIICQREGPRDKIIYNPFEEETLSAYLHPAASEPSVNSPLPEKTVEEEATSPPSRLISHLEPRRTASARARRAYWVKATLACKQVCKRE